MNRNFNIAARSAALLTLTVVLGAVFALLGASVASAGSWMEVSCINPNQSAAPSEGWSSFSGSAGFGSNNGTGCGPGSPMFAKLSNQAPAPVGANETLQYTPPGGSSLIGGSIDVALIADGTGVNATGTAVVYSPSYTYDSSNVVFQCAAGLGPCTAKGNAFYGVLALPNTRGGNVYVSAGCGGAGGASCNGGSTNGAWSLVRVLWANLLLSNNATPSASGVSGPLLSPNAHGTQDLVLNAADAGGPGVYAVTVQIDGKAVYSGTPDTNGGKCVAIGSSGGALMFDYSQPCRASESVDLPINTSSLPDGTHTLKVLVEDAAQNSSVVYDGPISTLNAAANDLGALPGAGRRLTLSGTLAGVGLPNGSNASEGANLRLGVRSAIVRTYAHRALRVTGRLLNAQGQPIAGATLDVLQQPGGAAGFRLAGHVKTAGDGTFASLLPGSGSRVVEIGYRAFSADSGYSAQAKVSESVAAGVQLQIAPRRTSSSGTIALSGRVLGPVPPQGVIVELLVHYRGHWQPFRTARTDSRGRFQKVYQFEGAIGRFPFRAAAFGGQAGFPFVRGQSRSVYVAAG